MKVILKLDENIHNATLIPSKVGGYKPTPVDRRSPLGWHRFLEACKFAYARRTLMGDWKHAESEGLEDEVSELVTNLTSSTWLDSTRGKISDTQTVNNASFYGAEFFNVEDAGTAHISVLSPAGDAVAVTSTVNLFWIQVPLTLHGNHHEQPDGRLC